MPRDKRNSIRIFWIQNEKEVTKRIYPKNLNWRNFSSENSYDLYNNMWSEVCKYFNVQVPDDLEMLVHCCYDTMYDDRDFYDMEPNKREEIYNSDMYQCWLDMWVDSHAVECVDSMFNDAYKMIVAACKNPKNRFKKPEYDMTTKLFEINWLFNEMLGNQLTNIEYHGAWILTDGSYIAVDTANHRRLLEEYLGLSEYEMERKWVKVSLGKIYTHRRMTSAQKKMLNKLFVKYPKLEEHQID